MTKMRIYVFSGFFLTILFIVADSNLFEEKKMDLHVSYQRRTFQSIYSRYLEHFIIYEIRLSIYLLRFVRVYI